VDALSWKSPSQVPVIKAATTEDSTALTRLYIAYRVFYGEDPEEERAAAFILDRLRQSSGRYFLGWNGRDAFHQHAGDAPDLAA
jgi:hypothetical protein